MNAASDTTNEIQLWERPAVKWFLIGCLAAIVLVFLMWWAFFRSYVSTNDARVATNIIRVAPNGVSGVVEKVLIEEGDVVKKDQVLVEIDHRIPQAQLVKAQARFKLAKTELDRANGLEHKGFSSVRDLDNARTNYDIAEAELKLAQINLQNTFLKSPIDGIVIQKLAIVGNILEPNQVAVIISDEQNAWVSANIEENSVGRIKVGQPVKISIDEGGTITGRVQEILLATASQFSLLPSENASGNFTKVVQRIPIKVVLDPHPGKILRAGQSVAIKIRVR